MPMDRMDTRTLTVVMPAYNEEALIEGAVREVQNQVFKVLPQARLVVVDDGSRDNTGPILDGLAEEDDRITIIHQENGGHGMALITGLESVQSDFVFLIDSDQQIPLTPFPLLWQEMEDHDGVFGIRAQRHDPQIRLVLTRFIRFVIYLLFGLRIRDVNVPFKILHMDTWKQARHLIPPGTCAPSMFLSIFMHYTGMKIIEKEVPHKMRQSPPLGVKRQWSLFKLTVSGFLQLLSFRKKLIKPIV